MADVTCPYCGYEQDEDEIYDPSTTYEVECSNCEKIFGVQVEYSPDYTIFALPFSNGEPHKMVQQRYPDYISRCEWCGHEEYDKEKYKKFIESLEAKP